MPTGRCHLCLETRELRDSHFIPAAFYKLLRAPGEKNPNPVVVNRNTQKQTSQQYRGHLLCAICEDRFNKGGEKWVLTNGWRTETDFPLRNALLAATPIPAWSVVLGAVAAGLLGWYLGEGDFLVPLYKGAFDTLAFRLLMSGAVAVMFGGIFGFAFPRWWYLVPIAGSLLDLALTARDFAGGGANLWPIAVGIRVVWMLLVLGGAFIGRLVRDRSGQT
jgi:hypothetical protein